MRMTRNSAALLVLGTSAPAAAAPISAPISAQISAQISATSATKARTALPGAEPTVGKVGRHRRAHRHVNGIRSRLPPGTVSPAPHHASTATRQHLGVQGSSPCPHPARRPWRQQRWHAAIGQHRAPPSRRLQWPCAPPARGLHAQARCREGARPRTAHAAAHRAAASVPLRRHPIAMGQSIVNEIHLPEPTEP